MSQNGFEKAYTTAEIAARLNIAQSTVRKYSQALEKVGYHFSKSNGGARLFVETDIAILMRMKEISAESKLPVDRIAEMFRSNKVNDTNDYDEAIQTSTGIATPNQRHDLQYDERYDELMERLKKLDRIDDLIEENRLLQAELSEIKKRLETTQTDTDNNDRDGTLMEVLREIQEVKKEVAASRNKKWYEFWK